MLIKTTRTIEPTESEPRWLKGTLISVHDERGKQMIADGDAVAAAAPPCEDGSDNAPPAPAAALAPASPKGPQSSARADQE